MRRDCGPEYRSSGRPGFSAAVAGDARHIEARKREREVQVRFTPDACTVQTPEGLVHAQPGDAIITGIAGDQWPVSRSRFPAKYRAVPPTRSGDAGTYVSLPDRIIAVSMSGPFAVLLSDGVSRLRGRAGDWLVDYGDGSLGVVSGSVFATTYEILW
jgi:hypothetical protein